MPPPWILIELMSHLLHVKQIHSQPTHLSHDIDLVYIQITSGRVNLNVAIMVYWACFICSNLMSAYFVNWVS